MNEKTGIRALTREPGTWSNFFDRPKNVPSYQELLQYKKEGIAYKDIPKSLWDYKDMP